MVPYGLFGYKKHLPKGKWFSPSCTHTRCKGRKRKEEQISKLIIIYINALTVWDPSPMAILLIKTRY